MAVKQFDRAAILKEAERLFKHKQFSALIRLLEKKITLFTDEAGYFLLLGMACYYQGDLAGGEIYLQRGIAIASDNIELRLALAVTSMRKRDTANAVCMWLEVLDIDPDNKQARNGLEELRLLNTGEDLARFIRSPKLQKLAPKFAFALSRKAKTALLLCLTIISLLAAAIFGKSFWLAKNNGALALFGGRTRESLENFNISSIKEERYMSLRDIGVYKLQPQEIRESLQKARNYFNAYEDNLARRELNRIKYSNASEEVKKQAYILNQALRAPALNTMKTNFSYREVASDPLLYEGCYVLWRGATDNVTLTPERIAFNLLVGYEEKQVLAGTVPVIVQFETFIDPSLPTETLGQIVINEDKSIYLEALSIHQIIKPRV